VATAFFVLPWLHISHILPHANLSHHILTRAQLWYRLPSMSRVTAMSLRHCAVELSTLIMSRVTAMSLQHCAMELCTLIMKRDSHEPTALCNGAEHIDHEEGTQLLQGAETICMLPKCRQFCWDRLLLGIGRHTVTCTPTMTKITQSTAQSACGIHLPLRVGTSFSASRTALGPQQMMQY